VRPFRLGSSLVRILLYLLGVVAGFLIVRWPGAGETLDTTAWPTALVVIAMLLGPAGLLYVVLVRTWVGTVVGGFALVGGWCWLVASIRGDHSSTAGLGVLGAPLLVAPVMVVFLVEMITWRRPLPPPPVSA
jgi:hypothetical protein